MTEQEVSLIHTGYLQQIARLEEQYRLMVESKNWYQAEYEKLMYTKAQPRRDS